jgi:hypothetical protein
MRSIQWCMQPWPQDEILNRDLSCPSIEEWSLGRGVHGPAFLLGPAHEPTVHGPMDIHGPLLYGTLIVEDH